MSVEERAGAKADAADAGIISVMMAALRETPLCAGLSEDQMLAICEEAVETGMMGSAEWLAQKVAFLKGEEYAAHPVVEGAKGPGEDEKEGGFRLEDIVVSERAEVKNREDLNPVLKAHEAWVDAVLNPAAKVAGGRANLSGVDLSGFDLEGVDLRGANLKGATLRGCNLGGANLSTADLTGADFTQALLHKAKLRKALLIDANFTCANLTGADLRRAEFKGADFTGADIESILSDKDIIAKPLVNHNKVAVSGELSDEDEEETLSSASEGEIAGDDEPSSNLADEGSVHEADF